MTGQFEGFRFGLRLLGGGIVARAEAWQTIHRLQQNLLFTVRLLRRNLGFTVVSVATLAIGIGANTAIFSVIYAVLLAPMPYPHPEQLVMVWSHVRDGNNSVSAGDYLERETTPSPIVQDVGTASGPVERHRSR